jgi:hypothetical protein
MSLSSFGMQRIDYRLKEFTRHDWSSTAIRSIWEQRIQRVCDAIGELEWISVREGVRACALRIVTPERMHSFGAMLARNGLTLAPLEKMAIGDWYSSARSTPLQDGEPFDYWCVIGSSAAVDLLKSAHSSRDVEAVGNLLGYPSCCRTFFEEVRIRQHFVDTTWPMAQNTATKRNITPTHLEIPNACLCSILLRWLGLRLVFHLPCSFTCVSTVALATTFAQMGRSEGFHQEMDWLEEMLDWRVEWSAVYGLAEITTPIGTIHTVTDATAQVYRVSYRGTGPANSVDGIERA